MFVPTLSVFPQQSEGKWQLVITPITRSCTVNLPAGCYCQHPNNIRHRHFVFLSWKADADAEADLSSHKDQKAEMTDSRPAV